MIVLFNTDRFILVMIMVMILFWGLILMIFQLNSGLIIIIDKIMFRYDCIKLLLFIMFISIRFVYNILNF